MSVIEVLCFSAKSFVDVKCLEHLLHGDENKMHVGTGRQTSQKICRRYWRQEKRVCGCETAEKMYEKKKTELRTRHRIASPIFWGIDSSPSSVCVSKVYVFVRQTFGFSHVNSCQPVFLSRLLFVRFSFQLKTLAGVAYEITYVSTGERERSCVCVSLCVWRGRYISHHVLPHPYLKWFALCLCHTNSFRLLFHSFVSLLLLSAHVKLLCYLWVCVCVCVSCGCCWWPQCRFLSFYNRFLTFVASSNKNFSHSLSLCLCGNQCKYKWHIVKTHWNLGNISVCLCWPGSGSLALIHSPFAIRMKQNWSSAPEKKNATVSTENMIRKGKWKSKSTSKGGSDGGGEGKQIGKNTKTKKNATKKNCQIKETAFKTYDGC